MKRSGRSIPNRRVPSIRALLSRTPVIGELTIRHVGHFNFLHTSKITNIYKLPVHFISGNGRGGTNVDSLRNPDDQSIPMFYLRIAARNFSRISSRASRDNFRKTKIPPPIHSRVSYCKVVSLRPSFLLLFVRSPLFPSILMILPRIDRRASLRLFHPSLQNCGRVKYRQHFERFSRNGVAPFQHYPFIRARWFVYGSTSEYIREI